MLPNGFPFHQFKLFSSPLSMHVITPNLSNSDSPHVSNAQFIALPQTHQSPTKINKAAVNPIHGEVSFDIRFQ